MTKIASNSYGRLFWIGAAAIVVFVYFFGLSIPLLGPDEPRYAQVAREMYERGDWVTPTLAGHNWFEKPALLYWLQIAFYNLFGVSEFSARLGSALFGLGTVVAMWVLGRTYASEFLKGANGSRRSEVLQTANWFALITASSLGLIVFARGASFDIILTFPIAAAMVSFYIFDSRVRTGDGKVGLIAPLFLFYFFVGVALLAKGLVGAVFPLGIAGIYYLISRRLPGRTFLLSLFWGAGVTLLVASSWYLPVYLKNGWEFVDEFIFQHHFQRYTSNKYLHPQPFYFFFWVLPLMTIPWLPFFLVAIWKFGKVAIISIIGEKEAATGVSNEEENAEVRRNDSTQTSSRLSLRPASAALLLFAAAWLLVPLVFFSFSGSKLPGYIMPALPPAIAITVVYLLGFMGRNEKRERWMKALAMATFAVVVGIIIFILPRFANMDSVKVLIAEADARGHGDEMVLTLHTVSHNAEFYAPGRLIRNADGKQKRLNGPAEVLAEVRKSPSKAALVLVPIEYQRQLEESPLLAVDTIRSNGEHAIAYVRERGRSAGGGAAQPVH